MKAAIKKSLVLVIVVGLALAANSGIAQDADFDYSVSFSDQELEDLLAPIALYPDPLLAQMLPAATYPQDIEDANAWLNSGGNLSDIDYQNWDESVNAVARYPDVLRMMADNMDWTANLGDAFLNQSEEVAKAIQQLRLKAQQLGNLAGNEKQEVIDDAGAIAIIPAQPQYIYVPVYDPLIVYVQRARPYRPFIVFGAPFVVGGWLIMDFDWHHRHVIYHGWNRHGWVNHVRPYVHITNVYVNKSRPLIRETWRHDSSRVGPSRYLAAHPSGPNANRHARTGEVRGRGVPPKPLGRMFTPQRDARIFSDRGRESRGIVNQAPPLRTSSVTPSPTIPRPHPGERRVMPSVIPQRPPVPAPRVKPVQPPVATTPPVTPPQVKSSPHQERVNRDAGQHRTSSETFGGYRSNSEAKALSARGQESRQKIGRMQHSNAHYEPVKAGYP